MKESYRFSGLSTPDALEKLYNVIRQQQDSISPKWTNINITFCKNILHHESPHTLFCWIPAFVTFVASIVLIFCSPWIGVLLLSVLAINVFLVYWDNYCRHAELSNRITFILRKIRRACEKCDWREKHFPHLCTPNSPSVSLQWTIRDQKVINLPTVLLSPGDLIVMQPGHQSPVECSIVENSEVEDSNNKSLLIDEVFSCHGSLYKLEQQNAPTVRHPLPNKVYKVLTPPIISHLVRLKTHFLNRPVSLYERARCILFNKFLFQLFLPVSFVIVEMVAALRLLFASHVCTTWVQNVVDDPLTVIFATIPLMFPLVWILISILGNATLLSYSVVHPTTLEVEYNAESSEAQTKFQVVFSWRLFWHHVIDIVFAKSATITRSVNLLHTLASVTSLCCVDKKGILSWPNPTAEKLFFLKNMGKVASVSDIRQNINSEETVENTGKIAKSRKLSAGVEILDLTHDNKSAWRLQFDDAYWQQHLPSLKPLGLAILLNTCNNKTHEKYSQFCSHITCQSLFTEHLVPVTNRRCLCELARVIGFKESTDRQFRLDLQLSTYRNVGDIIELDTRYMKNFFRRRELKLPFPHMVSVSVRTKSEHNGDFQEHLFTQGTADIILDCCTDYWNGRDLVPLTPSVRNKILDFYQRSSLTSYCTAFSYRPLLKKLDSKFSDVYIELPREKIFSRSHSSSSLYSPGESTALESDMDTVTEDIPQVVTDPTDCYKAQCNQIFIGMVSMQYQALMDMVQLIEELEKACIRFVHFSKENELRSRVFSEKMGLESGWNCHISLLGDYNSFVFSESLAHFEPLIRKRQNTDFNSSNVSFQSHNTVRLNSDDDSAGNNADADNSSATKENRKQQSVDDSTGSEVSYTVEENVPLGFDMSNRSKLPRGIENIRPHLQEVDNVPLLVSLFTDCTPEATKEMISIMQENGEVVCVIGSSANVHNVGIFVQADASIAIDPLYPQVCQREPVVKEFSKNDEPVTPIQLSQLLNSIPCSLNLRREDPLPIYHLILRARHIMQNVWNCVQFWLCCIAILTIVQMMSLILMMPAIFTLEQILWLNCFVIPLLSVSLISVPLDEVIMTKPTGKDWLCSFSIEVVMYVVWCYGAKLLVPIFSVLFVYGASLHSLCLHLTNIYVNTTYVQCSYTYPAYLYRYPVLLEEYRSMLWLLRHLALLTLLLNCVALSGSFLFREYYCWRKIPLLNATWSILVVLVFLVQLSYIFITRGVQNIQHIPLYVFAYFVVSPFITFVVCELVKLLEIRVNQRYHRKMRLMFGTKLGMNSPF